MHEGALPQIALNYKYGIDVLFYALRKIKYNASIDPGTSLFVNYSAILQSILKNSLFEDALTDISCLPHGEKLVDILLHFCTLPRKDISSFKSAYSNYLSKEKEKLLLLDSIIQRKWPARPFEVYILSKAGQPFSIGRTSPVFERTLFIPEKGFTDSVTHELIHFKVADFGQDFLTDYEKIIAQEVIVRLLHIYLNRVTGEKENIFHKKLEMAALGNLPLFSSCLHETRNALKMMLGPDDIERITSKITEKRCMIRRKDINLSILRILLENPRLAKDFLFDTVQYIVGC